MITKVMIPIIFSTMLLCGSALAVKPNEPKMDPVADAIDRLREALLLTTTQGPAGPPGPQGEPGPAGTIVTYTVVENVVAPSNGFARATMQCNEGDSATGGGYSLPSNMFVRGTAPINSENELVMSGETATGWEIFVKNENSSDSSFRGFVICADVTL